MGAIEFDLYLATIKERYQKALGEFRPAHRSANDFEQEMALRAALDYTNAELLSQSRFAQMLDYQLSRLVLTAEQSVNAVTKTDC